MRGAMPNEESVLVLIGKVAMDKDAYNRELPGIDRDKTLFTQREQRAVTDKAAFPVALAQPVMYTHGPHPR
jgi:hypothetical protein